MGWLWHALAIAGSMTWEILWALILGFALSAVVQAVVRRETVVRLLGDDSAKALAAATGLGMASSSCSYAAVALARSLFRKGASFTAAMAFELGCRHWCPLVRLVADAVPLRSPLFRSAGIGWGCWR